MAEALLAIGGMEVWASDTHYMLVQLRMGRAAALKEYLAGECGILIRDASNFEGLNEHFFRIAKQRETPGEERSMYGCCAYCIHLWSFCVIDIRIICYESLDRRGGFGRSYLLLFGRDYAYQ